MGTGAGEGGVTGRARVRGEGAGCQAAHRGGEPPRAKVRRRGGSGVLTQRNTKSDGTGCIGTQRPGCPTASGEPPQAMLKVFEGQRVENHEKTARLSFAFLFAWSRRGTATGPRQGTRRRGTDDAHGHRARRRDGDIAPYRNGTGPRERAAKGRSAGWSGSVERGNGGGMERV